MTILNLIRIKGFILLIVLPLSFALGGNLSFLLTKKGNMCVNEFENPLGVDYLLDPPDDSNCLARHPICGVDYWKKIKAQDGTVVGKTAIYNGCEHLFNGFFIGENETFTSDEQLLVDIVVGLFVHEIIIPPEPPEINSRNCFQLYGMGRPRERKKVKKWAKCLEDSSKDYIKNVENDLWTQKVFKISSALSNADLFDSETRRRLNTLQWAIENNGDSLTLDEVLIMCRSSDPI